MLITINHESDRLFKKKKKIIMNMIKFMLWYPVKSSINPKA